jgi:hypothetical protein
METGRIGRISRLALPVEGKEVEKMLFVSSLVVVGRNLER